jgi:NHLM bacteriocin system ABC transporter peptidase/ATP-binding protein
VSRDGSKASNVVKAARNYGLSARGAKLETAELRRQQLPCIVFWNFNHFLVVEGFGENRVYLNDPGCGPRRVTLEEFNKAYTGVALLIEPGPEFQPGGAKPSLINSLRPRLANAETALLFVILASLALVIPGLVVPVFTQVFVDDYLIGHLDSWVKPLLLGMALTAIVRAVLTGLQQKYLLRLEMRLALTGSSTFFWHVLRLPIEFFNQRYAGDISQRVATNDHIAHLLSGELATNAVNAVMVVFYLIVMLLYDWQLTLIGVLMVSLNLIALSYISRLRTDGNMKLLQDRGKLMATTIGGIQTIETIKATGAEEDFFMRWSGYKAKVNNTQQELEFYTRLVSLLPGLLSSLTTVSILGLGGAKVIDGEMTIGMLVAFQSLMGMMNTFQEATGDLTRLDDVLNYPMERKFTGKKTEAEPASAILTGHLELRGICFGYSLLEPPLIENFSLRLAPGQRVALVGGSGSGKSTISKIVMGINQPWSGQVLFDGRPREDVHPDVLCASLAGVEQEPYLFEGTVRDNLTLWDDTLPEVDMIRAAHDACIHDMIISRTDGYDGAVGEAGSKFSGGQAQRLEIARALAINPRILVLDEATAALDAVTERQIDEHIRQRGCTCMIVAHRLSTVRDCDEIIVMETGKIVDPSARLHLHDCRASAVHGTGLR